MRLLIEILAAILLVCCVSVTSAAAAGKMGRGSDGVSCGVSVPAGASPAARCAAIKRQWRREVLCERLRQVLALGGQLMTPRN